MFLLERTIKDCYYNGNNLLRQTDINDCKPSIYLSNTNRSAGKTTFFQLLCLDDVLSCSDHLFVLISRSKTEMESPETMFDNVIDYYYRENIMHSKHYVKNLVEGIYLDKKLVGFAVCLKDSSKLKKYSSIFSKVENIILDEVQPEDGIYLRDEVGKFQSLVATIARGGGMQSRPVNVFMLSNNITVMNPYFLNLKLYKYIDENANFEKPVYVKGKGFVAEFLYNESAAEAIQENTAISAFETPYNSIVTSAEFMFKSNSFVMEKISGKSEYLFTLKYKGIKLGVRKYPKQNLIYVSANCDPCFKDIVALTEGDHDELTIQLRNNTFYFAVIRNAYAVGKLRFSDLEVKNIMIELLGIDFYK